MDQTTEIVAQLASLLESNRNAALPPSMRWLGAEGIASMLDFKPRYVSERVATLPDFPAPLRLAGDGHPRWNVAEVQAWALTHREAHLAEGA